MEQNDKRKSIKAETNDQQNAVLRNSIAKNDNLLINFDTETSTDYCINQGELCIVVHLYTNIVSQPLPNKQLYWG